MTRGFVYPVRLRREPGGSGFVVTVPGLPEIVTEGENEAAALAAAEDALAEAIAGRIRRGEEIPVPSAGRHRRRVALPPLIAAKAALDLAVRESGLSRAEIARRLGVDAKEVRRLLDPRHPSKLPRLARALAVLGQRLEVRMVPAA